MNIKKLVKTIKYYYHLFNNGQNLLNKISFGKNSRIEYPFFSITGPEHIRIGHNSSVGRNAWISCYENWAEIEYSPKITIGNNVRIGNYACITSIDEITFEDGSLISDYLYVSDHSHDFNPEIEDPLTGRPLIMKGKVIIGNNCFIGMRVTIMPGVTIGKNCIIGSHSVVTKSFPDYSMIVGAPAKIVKKYNFETKSWEFPAE